MLMIRMVLAATTATIASPFQIMKALPMLPVFEVVEKKMVEAAALIRQYGRHTKSTDRCAVLVLGYRIFCSRVLPW